ncbi:hypothetical protein [Mycobacterium sp. shizuoka-1]|uniref:hypothetical protein n=1 Tax=Mycobacterium sp. shizuoka-1 TaxID=2039281 RepID=UPI000C05D96B|nr:hypothetical protein [Mycobacterium sp. shizuoka-1]GAY15929.1 hypothetical protein MSZK_26550 [Mycobacterium sp. shizuoka-1]
MDHIIGRPVAGAVAAAACAVVVATTTLVPSQQPAAPLVPRVSTEAVHLAVSPTVLEPAPSPGQPTAAASANGVNVGNPLTPVFAGLGAGVVAGFFVSGVVALNVIGRIPVIGPALMPIVPVIAIVGAIVGAPIGAVLSVAAAVKSWVSGLRAQAAPAAGRKAAAPTSGGAAFPGARSNRPDSKPTKPKATKAAAPQHSPTTVRAGVGHSRKSAAAGAARH